MNKLAQGIDISAWQGVYNLQQAKAEGFDFVIIKGGGGDDGLYTDSKFARNYDEAKRLNMNTGVYWFSKALTIADAKKEAEYFYNTCLKGRKFELPVYIDVENKTQLSIGKDLLTEVIKTWCDYLEKKGYWVGIYSSQSMFSTYMHDDQLQRYAHWVACWAKDCDYGEESFGMWQYGGETNLIRSNKVAGQTTDQNYMLIDYPKYIKEAGLNGYGMTQATPSAPSTPAPSTKPVTSSKKYTASKLLDIARSQLGYKEKETNSQLDDFNANAGDGNYTKYARDLAEAGYYQASKQGFEWCDMFVDWCFLQLCGNKKEAEDMTCQTGLYGAGCTWSAQYYKNQGRYSEQPKVGDQIFFGDYDHTGLVEKVSGSTITTIEGNTQNQVLRHTYSINDNYITGYGHPKYDEETIVPANPIPAPVNPAPSKDEYTLEEFIQDVQRVTGSSVDGIAGSETLGNTVTISQYYNSYHAVVKYVQKRLAELGYNEVGEIDGVAGPKFDKALKAFQKDKGCVVDGEATARDKTWKKLLGMA